MDGTSLDQNLSPWPPTTVVFTDSWWRTVLSIVQCIFTMISSGWWMSILWLFLQLCWSWTRIFSSKQFIWKLARSRWWTIVKQLPLTTSQVVLRIMLTRFSSKMKSFVYSNCFSKLDAKWNGIQQKVQITQFANQMQSFSK